VFALRFAVQCCPSIRLATEKDRSAIDALLYGSHRAVELTTVPGSRYALVLEDVCGRVAAAAVVIIDRARERGHLAMLVVAKELDGAGIENRVVGVAEALCCAFGCKTLDVPAGDIRQAA
jgi:hypothetical protein